MEVLGFANALARRLGELDGVEEAVPCGSIRRFADTIGDVDIVGEDPEGVEILALNGRYGPYIQRGDDKRSLQTEEELLTLTVEEALKLLAEPARRRGQSRTQTVREIGTDPASGKPVTLRSGRYGPYVTDGDVNASLRKGDSPEKITIERAADLLQARRDKLGK